MTINDCKHDFEEDYYGFFHCKNCPQSLPPWALYDDDYSIEDDPKSHSLQCTCETCIQNHPERIIYDAPPPEEKGD